MTGPCAIKKAKNGQYVFCPAAGERRGHRDGRSLSEPTLSASSPTGTPSSASAALLAEQHDEWLTDGRRYLTQASINRLLGGGPNPTLGELLKEGIAV